MKWGERGRKDFRTYLVGKISGIDYKNDHLAFILKFFVYFLKFIYFIYLFLAALVLRCGEWVSLCGGFSS